MQLETPLKSERNRKTLGQKKKSEEYLTCRRSIDQVMELETALVKFKPTSTKKVKQTKSDLLGA